MQTGTNDLKKRIKSKIPYLTKTQKVIANYIVENPEKFALSSIRELEKELKISKSTIVRLAQMLGYEGFYDLKSRFLKKMRHNFGPINRYKTFLSKPKQKFNFVQWIADETENNIQKTLGLLDCDQYNKAVDMLKTADHVYAMGLGISSFLAEIATYLFTRISINSNHLTHGALTFPEQIINLSKKDALFAFSFPPYSKETIEAARYAKERSVRIICMTDKATNKIVSYSDVFLQVSVESITISNSIISVLMVLYAIIAQVGHELKNKTLKTIEAIEHIRKEHV